MFSSANLGQRGQPGTEGLCLSQEFTLASLMPRSSEILLHRAPGPCSEGQSWRSLQVGARTEGSTVFWDLATRAAFSRPFTSVLVVANTGV